MYIVYEGFELYTPESNEENDFLVSLGAAFLRDSSGQDWYKLSKELEIEHPGAFYVSLRLDNKVLGVSDNAVGLFPHNMRLVVTDAVPDGMTEYPRNWEFTGDGFEKHLELSQEEAEDYQETELTWASNQIGALTDLQEIKGITEEQTAYLKEVKVYRSSLVLMDLTNLVDIQWPTRPTK